MLFISWLLLLCESTVKRSLRSLSFPSLLLGLLLLLLFLLPNLLLNWLHSCRRGGRKALSLRGSYCFCCSWLVLRGCICFSICHFRIHDSSGFVVRARVHVYAVVFILVIFKQISYIPEFNCVVMWTTTEKPAISRKFHALNWKIFMIPNNTEKIIRLYFADTLSNQCISTQSHPIQPKQLHCSPKNHTLATLTLHRPDITGHKSSVQTQPTNKGRVGKMW